MGRASILSLHDRSQIKALSTVGYTVKRIADVVKCSRKAIINFLRHQEEYGAKKSSGRPGNLNDLEKREILRTTSSSTISINEIRRTCDIDASKTTRNGTDRLGVCVSFTFQQENATIHTSRSTKTWLEDIDVDTIDWPSSLRT
uniref:HTH_Tnp_Tc3_1 domain-containing protein n=1 Tax=Heterorhabditis bacteriophora TaxID=37862 RepID=A0A1I7WMY7_HETBA